jgi:hypothetical protein
MDHEQLKLAVVADLRDSPRFTEPRAARLLGLRKLDAVAINPLVARAPAPMDVSLTYSVPYAFVCSDNAVWWLKPKAQQGLCVEVIAGRLAKLVGAGPGASPILVGADAIAGQLGLIRFRGNVAGIEHRPGVESSKKLAKMMAGSNDALPVDASSRALVIAFQTWLDVSDPQVLVNMLTGEVETHDHGETFAELKKGPPARIVIARIPGVADHVGLGRAELEAAVRRIEALTESDILWAVACIPDEPGWRATFDRRLAIAEWLIKRQSRLREVLIGWGALPS